MESNKIKYRVKTTYHPHVNGQVEGTHKIIEVITTNNVQLHLKDWVDRFPEALWDYWMIPLVVLHMNYYMTHIWK